MDVETGEVRPNRDQETGEWIPYEYDNETGEETTNYKRITFKIPNSYKKPTKKVLSLSKNSKDMSPVLLFLLPTLFVYPGITSVIVAILEVIIHTWAHKVNKKLANKNVYYKSPMHIIASEFCAKCRDITSMDQIEKIQDKRTHRYKCNYEYVKRIVT